MVLPVLVACGLSFATGFALSHKSNDFSSETTYCEAPSNIIRESYLLEESNKWQKEYEHMEDQWLQCTRDLARISEECNYDIICSEGTCEDQ